MAKTHEQFVEELSIINPDILVIGKYTRAVDCVDVMCKRCGMQWSPKAYSLTQGKSCPHCSAIKGSKNNKGKTGLKSTQQFIEDLKKVNDSISIIGPYKNNHTNIACQCNICNHQWYAKPYSLLQNHGCPRCAKSGTSFMEQFILLCFSSVLGEKNVVSRDKTLIGYELDIYIPKYKIAFEPGNWNLHKKNIARDELKRKKCQEKGIRLITIYDKYSQNKLAPFSDNCFIFTDDLNKANHSIITNLVYQLFEIVGINYHFSEKELSEIETVAYENALSRTHKDFVLELKKIHPNIEVLGKYENSNKRILVKCKTCGFQWNGVPANMLAGDGCRKCGTKEAHKKFIKSQDRFVAEIEKVNPNVEIIGTYVGRHSPIRAKCKVCGYIWEPITASLLRGSIHKNAKSMHKSI